MFVNGMTVCVSVDNMGRRLCQNLVKPEIYKYIRDIIIYIAGYV